MTEQTVHEARLTWNKLDQDVRKVIVRWLALDVAARKLFCKIVCGDGNCKHERKL